ncbi:MAG: GNAT family N-acetyltransferase [Bacteroidota bacterium]
MISFRTMKPADLDAALSLCRSANWNQLARDWQIFLQFSPEGCRVALKDEKVVGTVTTVRYQDFFSWIGMVLVDPANQRQGIGMQLLKEALEVLKNEETVKLDATPAGREVYLKLNFVDEYRVSRMKAVITANAFELSGARSINKTDLAAIALFDREIFGADRQQLLQWMWEGAPQYAFIAEDRNEIQGYCLGRSGYNFTHIGPVVARNINVAKNLVTTALKLCIGKPVIIDAMHFEIEWMQWLASIGFTEQRPFVRMYRGTNKYPGQPEKQFAILGPEFG